LLGNFSANALCIPPLLQVIFLLNRVAQDFISFFNDGELRRGIGVIVFFCRDDRDVLSDDKLFSHHRLMPMEVVQGCYNNLSVAKCSEGILRGNFVKGSCVCQLIL